MAIIGIETGGVFGVALNLSMLMLTLALLATVWRLVAGPTAADRVVALDLISVLLVVILMVFAMASGVNEYVYAAIALALIAFLSTVAFAHYIERSGGREDE